MKIYVQLVLTAIFWGGTFIAGRQVAQRLPPFTTAFLRFATAAVLLLLLTWRYEGRFPRLDKRQTTLVILLGLTGVFAYNAMFFGGLRHIEAGRAALIIAICPAVIALASAALLREPFGLAKILGILLSVFGAIVVVSQGRPHQILAGGVGVGELLILGCVASWVVYSLVGKVVMKRLSPLASVAYSAVVGAVALGVSASFEGFASSLSLATVVDWLSIAYLAVFGTVLGFVWFYQGVQRIGPTRAGLFINIVPISAVVLAFVILREPVTWSLAVGAALVLTGVFLTNAGSIVVANTCGPSARGDE
jgi:drug/metabolite transporter (DMT)-like permease